MYRTIPTVLALTLAGAAANADEVVVSQKNRQFGEATATLNRGDKITFVNDDGVAHNVFISGADGETKNSGVQKPGEYTSFTFDKAGNFAVECGIHPKMHMSITVK
jgi:plastocyanin